MAKMADFAQGKVVFWSWGTDLPISAYILRDLALTRFIRCMVKRMSKQESFKSTVSVQVENIKNCLVKGFNSSY
jgi:hypothetical protein